VEVKKIFFIYFLFILLGSIKAVADPSEVKKTEYSEIQESIVTDFWDNAEDPQKANKMLFDYLEKQDKTITRLGLIPTRVGNFTDYTPLLAFKDLETLDIDNFLITDISGITVLSQHEKLSKLILWAEKVTDIRPLSALINLRLLNISINNTCTNASELLYLINLESLVFRPASSETINNISRLTWLKLLYLGLDYEGIDISPIQNLKNLERLTIRGPRPNYEKTEIDISWISQMTNLQELELDGYIIKDISPLLKLSNLKIINVMFSDISEENIALLRATGTVIFTPADADR